MPQFHFHLHATILRNGGGARQRMKIVWCSYWCERRCCRRVFTQQADAFSSGPKHFLQAAFGAHSVCVCACVWNDSTSNVCRAGDADNFFVFHVSDPRKCEREPHRYMKAGGVSMGNGMERVGQLNPINSPSLLSRRRPDFLLGFPGVVSPSVVKMDRNTSQGLHSPETEVTTFFSKFPFPLPWELSSGIL